MKQIISIVGVLLMITLFTACESTEDKTKTPLLSESLPIEDFTSSEPLPNNPLKVMFEQIIPDTVPENFDLFHYQGGTGVVEDKNGDIYFISHTGIYKIPKDSGKVEIVLDGFTYGKTLGIHNKWIYYIIENRLFRIDKNGDNQYGYPMYFDDGYASVYIYHEDLYFTSYDGNDRTLYYADISNDPDTLEVKKAEELEGLSEYYEQLLKMSDEIAIRQEIPQKDLPFIPITISKDYFYLKDHRNVFYQYNPVSDKIETLPLTEVNGIYRFSIISDWIYYEDNDGAIWRIKENLSEQNRLTEPVI